MEQCSTCSAKIEEFHGLMLGLYFDLRWPTSFAKRSLSKAGTIYSHGPCTAPLSRPTDFNVLQFTEIRDTLDGSLPMGRRK